MKNYLIIYQLGFPEANYQKLLNYIKSAIKWAHPMANTWIISTTKDCAEIRDNIKKFITAADKVIVIEVPINHWATSNITKEVTDWMRNNMANTNG
jgi:sugar-specific transcriptional regulator TrmB